MYELYDSGILVIDGEEFNLLPTGAAYAAQFGRLTAWIGTHGLNALLMAQESGVLDVDARDTVASMAIISFMMNEGISPESLIEVACIVTGGDKAFIEEHFDPGWFVESLIMLFDKRPGIVKAMQKLYERFFLANSQQSSDQEDQAQDT